MTRKPRVLYLDQNAWIALAQGSWDGDTFPVEHAALTRVVRALQADGVIVPLSFTNIYETSKINDPVRRMHLARVQVTLSGGKVLRSRRRILEETLVQHIARRTNLPAPVLADGWFLSDLWFESAAEYTPDAFGFPISERALDLFRRNPAHALFTYLTDSDDAVRLEAVRRYSANSVELIRKLDARRSLAAGETFALRLKAYSANLVIDELDFICRTAKRLGLAWTTIHDIGPSLLKSFVNEVPILNVERELVVRLEDQDRAANENDLRDVASFAAALPLVHCLVGEKASVNLARQARLGEKYSTVLLTKVSDLTDDVLGNA